jgi:hypothetical protein
MKKRRSFFKLSFLERSTYLKGYPEIRKLMTGSNGIPEKTRFIHCKGAW